MLASIPSVSGQLGIKKRRAGPGVESLDGWSEAEGHTATDGHRVHLGLADTLAIDGDA